MTLAVATKGFRPFFLLAAAYACVVVPVWLLALHGLLRPSDYLDATYWHAHEMVFGYATAVVAGFLLTAVGNWTKRETAVGAPLLGLASLWLAGRVALALGGWLPRGVPAVVDVAFLPALAVTVARPLLAARNRRNFVMVAALVVLALANLATHLDVLGVAPGWRRRGSLLGVDVIVLLVTVVAGRVVPTFTRNATGVATVRSHPRLDAAAVGSLALVALGEVAGADDRVVAVAAAVAAACALARTVHWGAWRARRDPLLLVLHVGYAWVPAGLALRAAAGLGAPVPASLATHALTVGAIGTLTLGMMARVALGHTGRPLRAPPVVAVGFALVTLSALVRVVGALVAPPPWYLGTVVGAGALWTAAFVAYLVACAPIVLAPRIDEPRAAHPA